MAILIERRLRRRRRKETFQLSKQVVMRRELIRSSNIRSGHLCQVQMAASSSRQKHHKVRGGDQHQNSYFWPTKAACAINSTRSPLFYLLHQATALLFLTILVASTLNLSCLSAEANQANSNNNNNLNAASQASQIINSYHQQQSGALNSVIMTSSPPPPQTTSQKPRYKTMYACEDRQLSMDCDYGYKINLIRANFGRFSIATCNDQGQLDLSTDCKSPITFRIMTDRCQDKQKCSVNATSAIFGDKCPKTRKYLEVHFQCQPDLRVLQQQTNDQVEKVDLRNPSANFMSNNLQPVYLPTAYAGQPTSYGPVLPPNNPSPSNINMPASTTSSSSSSSAPNRPTANMFADLDPTQQTLPPTSSSSSSPSSIGQRHLPQQPLTVMNSEMLNYNLLAESKSLYKANDSIVVTLRHTHTENMSNPRCVLWDPTVSQWVERGSRIVDTNLTHTTCAFDQASHYLLVMDYLNPFSTISQVNPTYYPSPQQIPVIQPSMNPITPALPELLDLQPVPIDQASSTKNLQERLAPNQTSSSRFFSLLSYMLAFVFISIAFMTIVFVISTMRSSAGAALKSLGNFTAFGGPKYKARRPDGTLHNKDLLVINNQNGHQFLYAPANTTKISSSSSTHILSGTVGHQGTLHQIQQAQLYSGNATLSNLSGTGGQSNNYYYGLTGLNNLFQAQQQQQQQQQQQHQHHLSQHHLNQQQINQTSPASYLHQANKSTISTESANSSPSSSGVESGSTSVQQHQQQQSCLVMNNDYNLMGHLGNLDQSHQQQQPTLTLNAHYSSSGVTPMSMMQAQQQQRFNLNQLNNSNREHIYECVDDDKTYSARMLMPEQFNSNTLSQHQASMMMNGQQSRALTLSSRLPQSSLHQQQAYQIQQQQQQQQSNKRLFSHPAIIRDNPAKTSIICSKIAQVTPQRAIEINKFQHDVIAIYNGHDSTTTTTTTAANSSSSGNSSTCYGRSETGTSLNGPANNKLSTDC